MAKSPMIPVLQYKDAKAAMDWLSKAFGFEKKAAYEDDKGRVMHAEMTFGNSMIMLGTASNEGFGKYMIHPSETGGRATSSIYVIVPDADAHYARAKAAGAKIVMEPTTKDYGGRDYACYDLEGHLWSIGTYDPWEQ